MTELASRVVALVECSWPSGVITKHNEAAAQQGADIGLRLIDVYPELNERRLSRVMKDNRPFSQLLETSFPSATYELTAELREPGFLRIEVYPAAAVSEIRASMDHYVMRVEGLSKELKQFPESNPNPVLRASEAGELLYANPAARACMPDSIDETNRLPDEFIPHLNRKSLIDFEIGCGNRWFSVRPVWSKHLACFLLYMTDVTSDRKNQLILSNLARFFSPRVAASIVSHEGEIKVRTSRKMLTVFFADLVGFSQLAEDLPLESLSDLLFDYLSEMTKIAERHGGTVDKYIGDCIMVFFGDPSTAGAQADAASCAAMGLEMLEAVKAINRTWRSAHGFEPLQVRMGMHSATCAVGNFGSQTRLDYTAIGNGVNVAARLEGIAETNTIACSATTAKYLSESFELDHIGDHYLKNITEPVTVFRIAGHRMPT